MSDPAALPEGERVDRVLCYVYVRTQHGPAMLTLDYDPAAGDALAPQIIAAANAQPMEKIKANPLTSWPMF